MRSSLGHAGRKSRLLSGGQEGFSRICEAISFGLAGVVLAAALAVASQRITHQTFLSETIKQDYFIAQKTACDGGQSATCEDVALEDAPFVSPVSTLSNKGPLLVSEVEAPSVEQEVQVALKGNLMEPSFSITHVAPRKAALLSLSEKAPLKKEASLKKKMKMSERDCLATAVYYEAGSESDLGKYAVANVILNRTRNPSYPRSICGVVYQGVGTQESCQFSFACDGKPKAAKNRRLWAKSREIAARAIAEGASELQVIATATHFHADYVRPHWADTMKRLIKIGRHIFYSES